MGLLLDVRLLLDEMIVRMVVLSIVSGLNFVISR